MYEFTVEYRTLVGDVERFRLTHESLFEGLGNAVTLCNGWLNSWNGRASVSWNDRWNGPQSLEITKG